LWKEKYFIPNVVFRFLKEEWRPGWLPELSISGENNQKKRERKRPLKRSM
jgi:hypothetical protein